VPVIADVLQVLKASDIDPLGGVKRGSWRKFHMPRLIKWQPTR
jgi:hypothetical protein